METYPTIPRIILNTPIYAFDKLDGSNIRAEWNRKSGFSKFGSRRRLLDPNEKPLGEAVELFMNKYADELESIFRKERYIQATAFVEFHGPKSFAGFHAEEEHDVTLFDVHVYKQGMLPPKEFLKLFKYVDTAPLLYQGIPNKEFQEQVKNSELKGMTFEGVVCKGTYNHKHQIQTFKLKSYAWLNALKTKYGNDEKLLNSLM